MRTLALIGAVAACSGTQTPDPDNRSKAPDAAQATDVVVVVQGTMLWMGNEQYANEGGDVSVFEGAHSQLAPALKALVEALPAESQIAVVVHAEVRAPLAPKTALDAAAAIGPQTSYSEFIAAELLASIDKAVEIFGASKAAKQALIVIGEGRDSRTVPEALGAKVSERIELLRKDGVLGYSIFYRTGTEDNGGKVVSKTLGYTLFREAASRDDIPGMVGAIGAAIGSR